ncbi:hypothetical protein AVEN_30599-1 [Araneus ventricosus]|uniref:Peptidase A2 domain-containing protein n=1 Tax=Araneus ventricosus TaxID=182803 RepID=A0A4Y2ENE0_ARAVE|nr:hypothetical protein AVEN_30599-1 [Araneus ventricosus]
MQQILSVFKDGLNKLAKIADKIGETTAIVSATREVLTRPSLSMLEVKVEELTNQVQRLSRELARKKSRCKSSKSHSRSRFPAHTNIKKCWYHTRFADKAKKCVEPCSFSKNFKNRQTLRQPTMVRDSAAYLFKFMTDSGAACSVFPVSSANLSKHVPDANFILYTANSSVIRTYGTNHLTPDLGLRRSFPWTSVIADVSRPILGSFLLERFELLIDIKKP